MTGSPAPRWGASSSPTPGWRGWSRPMSTIFWDVDTQHDFIQPTGKLYVPGAERIVPTLRALTDYAHGHGIRIIASPDDHVPGHRALSPAPDFRATFPERCRRGTEGQRTTPETTLTDPRVVEPGPDGAVAGRVKGHGGDILFHKHWFDVFTNANVVPV